MSSLPLSTTAPTPRAKFSASLNSAAERVTLNIRAGGTLKSLVVSDHTFVGTAYSDHARHCYFFKPRIVQAGDVVRIWTGLGIDKATPVGSHTEHDLYWGMHSSVWNNAGDQARFWWTEPAVLMTP